MDWLYKLFYPSHVPADFTGAGCIFTNDTHILAGYQPNKKRPYIGGIGGKREGNEEYVVTALRETLEELFMIHPTRQEILDIYTIVKPSKVFNNGSYIILKYSFQDLELIMQIVGKKHDSSLYNEFPTTIADLILNRLKRHSELTQLVLLPYEKNIKISQDFVEDINFIYDLRPLISQ